MMTDKHSIEELIDHAEAYATTKVRLTKLQVVEKGSRLSGSIASSFFFILVIASIFGLLSIAGAFALSQWLGSNALGFLAMGGCYSLIGIVVYINRERWIRRPVANAIVKTVLIDEQDENE